MVCWTRRLGALGIFALVGVGCGGSDRKDGASGDDDGSGLSGPTISESGSTEGEADTAADGILDLPDDDTAGTGGDDGGTECPPPPNSDATLEGTVYSPNLQIPISGALVYLTDEPVEPVPAGTYCAECVELDCNAYFTLTNPDGSFSLPAVAGPGQQLVVQKGQFLHVVDFDVVAGSNFVPFDQSNLPGRWDPANGLWIPRIAVYDTDPDRVYNVLAKFGLGEVTSAGQLITGTEQFAMISDTDQGAFMDDLADMMNYHIIFVPCAATKTWINAPTIPPARVQNIRDYVEAGGKWYATDHSNEYVKDPFPTYQDFHNEAMPDIQPAYTSIGTVVDPDLLAWLEALPEPLKDIGGGYPTLTGLPSLTTELSYSGIDAVHEIIVQNEEGEDVNVGHHTWVEGPCQSCSDPVITRPMAVSGQFGCGRMMYSTFETSSVQHAGLSPQELVLLYMILEIGVCFGDPPPPPPPID